MRSRGGVDTVNSVKPNNSGWSERKLGIHAEHDRLAPERDAWIRRNQYYYQYEWSYLRFLVPECSRVLELGCDTGQLLAALKPSRGVGVDISEGMIEVAKRTYSKLEFHTGDIEDLETIDALEGPFDVIILSDTIGFLDDCEETMAGLHKVCGPETRFIVVYYSHLWEPVLRLTEKIGAKMPMMDVNWLSTKDIINLLELADFDVVKHERKQLLPKRLLGLGLLVNRFIAPLPGFRLLCLRQYVVARSLRASIENTPSASVVIPCRNERGNIEVAVQRLPRFCDDLEVIFVEGHSSDGTFEEALRVKEMYADRNIKVVRQEGEGKGDAMRKGFETASGDILMILDADLTVAPETLPKFYRAIAGGKGEFVNGTRLVYPMQRGAMQFLNTLANRAFAAIFSFLLDERFTDTLCGTKALSRRNYRRIADNRAYFGELDPFGDFDLIFGAAKLGLKFVEIPVRYASRAYGTTQISRFRHGWMLIRMVARAFLKLKAI